MVRHLLSITAAVAAAVLIILWLGCRDRGEHYPELAVQLFPAWHSFGGDWNYGKNVYSNRSNGRGDKLVGGPTGNGNYAVSADLRFDTAPQDPSFGDAGLLLRVLDPAIGVDEMRGYYAALRPDDHMLLLGAMSFGFRELATTPFPHELHPGRWYHLVFTSRDCTFALHAQDTVSGESAELSYVEQACDPVVGQVGMRSYYAKASWRDFKVNLLH